MSQSAPGQSEQSVVAYTLGSGDRIQLRAVIWDETQLAHVPWDAVNGTFTISAEGLLNIPLAGRIEASGLSLPDLSALVSENLQNRVKLVEPPSVTLEIEKYRSFFILGDVDQPGAYEATPGLNAIQAYAVAGGAPALRDALNGDLRSVLRDAGSLSHVRREQVRARIRVMRLLAELEGRESFAPDTSDIFHPDGRAALTALVDEERAVFDARRRGRMLETQNLEELKVLLTTEIRNLQAKRDRLQSQIMTAQEAIDDVQALGERGLVRDDRIRDALRAMFELESQDFDLQNALFRSQQRIKEADRDIVGLNTRLATEVTDELQRMNAQIEELAVRAGMLTNLVQVSGLDVPQSEQEFVTEYVLIRAGGDGSEERASRATHIGPGDILRVERRALDPAN
ncbi:hypothetical protein ATO3_13990 [Marinibacterium profundimaris]|uniref:Soluble ligand binding domain-containing protein n=1 Tax=Marinibacterium profundimaris TaxID=1679460 RepID=A0A225NH92_9RHOB|nr:hypothetical protein ATO3_13990 [Marinibacterium profundimaris]